MSRDGSGNGGSSRTGKDAGDGSGNGKTGRSKHSGTKPVDITPGDKDGDYGNTGPDTAPPDDTTPSVDPVKVDCYEGDMSNYPEGYDTVEIDYTYNVDVASSDVNLENALSLLEAEMIYHVENEVMQCTDAASQSRRRLEMKFEAGVLRNGGGRRRMDGTKIFCLDSKPVDTESKTITCDDGDNCHAIEGRITSCMTSYSSSSACEILGSVEDFFENYSSSSIEKAKYTGTSLRCGDNAAGIIVADRVQIADDGDDDMGAGGWVGISLALAALIALLLLLCIRRRKNSNTTGGYYDGDGDDSDVYSKDAETIGMITPDSSPEKSVGSVGTPDGAIVFDEDFDHTPRNADPIGLPDRDDDEDSNLESDPYKGRRLLGASGNFGNHDEMERYENAVDVHRCKSGYCADCARRQPITFISTKDHCSPATILESPDEYSHTDENDSNIGSI